MKILKLGIFYTVLIVYAVELCLFLYIPKEQKMLVNLSQTRLELAKNQNIDYDLRSPEEVFLELKNQKENIKPGFYYAPIFSNFKTFLEYKENNKLIPFRGPINSKSISCTEDLRHRIIQNDKYGFRNYNKIYEKPIHNVILGDSYAEGFCVGQQEDISANLNLMGYPTANLAVGTTSPLVSLAVLREFGEILKPKNFIYFYYEGNDLQGLEWEKKQGDLIKYLEDEYTVGYVKRYDEINQFLDKISKESIDYAIAVTKNNSKNKEIKNNNFKETFQDILEINNIRNILKNSLSRISKNNYDLELFYKIIYKMNQDAKKLDSNYIFVYVPTWSRYFTKFTKKDKTIYLKDEILKKLDKMNIETVDLTEIFDKENDIKIYFPLGYAGHFNDKGYKKISEVIADKL